MTTTRLQILRSQLTGLRQARANARLMSALSALGTALLWSLAGMFAIDWLFQREMQPPQRMILLLIGAGIVYWAFRKFAQPLLSVRETEVDMALMVERQQQIDSDLVAAIQFEDDVEGRWGSRQLETAVIDYVAHLGPDIDVFQGFNREQLKRRGIIFGVTAAMALLAALLFPGHVAAFVNRLALGSAHYPSATQIQSLAVNGRSILSRGLKPENIRCAEGREIEFLVRSAGRLPEAGLARLTSLDHSQRTDVELKPLSRDDRLARLHSAQKMIDEARQMPERDFAGPWFEELAALVQFEAPDAWQQLELDAARLSANELNEQVEAKLPAIEQLLQDMTAQRTSEEGESEAALYVGHLPRLNEAVSYRLTLGDAYTDPAEIRMIALPAVEARLTPIPPKYAAKAIDNEPAGRQAAVLVGSEVRVAIECTNKKRLKEAWIIVRSANTSAQRYELQPTDDERTAWSLVGTTPFSQVEEELRYEIQVTDEDGMHLETPIKGSVRMRADKPPVAIASTVHRVVLPTAKPSIQYRVGDDFGIKRLELVVQVERQGEQKPPLSASAENTSGEESTAATSTAGGEEVKLETTHINLLAAARPITLERLPLAGKAAVNLASLRLDASRGNLQKGDRLKVVLVAEDDRGPSPGETFRSEPIIIEISDEFGVASAVGEADPQAEQRVTEIIKRQLGIGESP